MTLHLSDNAYFFGELFQTEFESIFEGVECIDNPVPLSAWFRVPSMAILAADLYQRPVVILVATTLASNTYLPFTPTSFEPISIVLVHVNENHWMLGNMSVMRFPRVDPQWLGVMSARRSSRSDLVEIYDAIKDALMAWNAMFGVME